MTPEGKIQGECLAALKLFRDVKVWRNNTGRRGMVSYGLGKGSSDIVGILRGTGRMFCLEVKVPGKSPSADQSLWLDTIREYGGFAAVVTSTSEAIFALKRAINGDTE